MADDVRQLLLQISASTELLQSNLRRAESQIASWERNSTQKIDRFEREFKKVGVAAGGVSSALGLAKGAALGFFASLSIGGLVDVTRKALDYAGSLGEVAQSLGVGTQFLQEFRFAATQNGASIEGADNALGKFSVSIGKALDGGKTATAAFTKLGISMADLRKGNDAERFNLVADAIAKIPDPAQRASAAQAIFGKGFREILPLLEQGARGFSAAAAEARKMGLVLSDKQIQDADKTADKFDALGKALQVRIAGVVTENVDALNDLIDGLEKLINYSAKALKAWTEFANLKPGNTGLFSRVDRFLVDNVERPLGLPDISGRPKPAAAARPANGFNTGDLRNIGGGPRRFPNGPARAPGLLGAGGFYFGGLDFNSLLSDDQGSLAAVPARVGSDAKAAQLELGKLSDLLSEISTGPAIADNSLFEAYNIDGTGELDAIRRQIDARLDAEYEANQQIADDYAQRMEDRVRFLAGTFEDLFSGSVDNVLENLKRQGLAVVAEIAARLAINALSGKKSDFGAIASQALTSIFGGARAEGGPVDSGRAYLVGERGRELFVPRVPGSIVSNDNLRGLGGALRVQVVKGDLFDVIVDQRAASVAQPMVASGMVQASQGAQVAVARRSSRSLNR